MIIDELDKFILANIQGVFNQDDMKVLKEEVEKLQPGQIYLEIGVDEGRSLVTAIHYAPKGVFCIGIDINDHPRRAEFTQRERLVGIRRRGFFIHGDADYLAEIWATPVNLLFIDGHHDYESVKANTLRWEPLVRGTILFHDYDHVETRRWLDEHYGDNKEVLHNKIVRVRL